MPNSVVKTLTVNGTTYDLKDVDSESYAPKASPALTGTPTAPTASSGTNSTQVATTAFVQDAISGLSTSLSGLSDTTITTPSDGQVLTYDSTTSKWVNELSEKEVFIVNISYNNGEYVADKTQTEVAAAYASGKLVYAVDYYNWSFIYGADQGGTYGFFGFGSNDEDGNYCFPRYVYSTNEDAYLLNLYDDNIPTYSTVLAKNNSSIYTPTSDYNPATKKYVDDNILSLGTSSTTAFRGDYGNSAYTHAVTNKGSAFASGLYKITTNSEGHVTAATAVQKSDITGLGIPSQDTTYTFDGTYNSSTNKAATVSTVTNAIGALDGVITGSAGAGKTLTAFSQTDGKVTATFGDISITKSQVSDFAHTHDDRYYTETEIDTNFATKQYVDNASTPEVLVVTFTSSGASSYTANKTYSEITTAYNAGKIVYGKDPYRSYIYTNADDVNCFKSINAEKTEGDYISYYYIYYDDNDSDWTIDVCDLVPWPSLNLSGNILQLKSGSTVISSITLPVYNGGVSS